MIEAVKLRAGLLLELAPEVFGFPHRTFQEYLAGAYLASEGDFARRAASLAGEGARWREVILLAVGRLVYVSGDLVQPLALVSELCPAAGPGDTEVGWRKAWLAGEVLNEIAPERVLGYALGRELRERVPARLADLIRGGRLTPRERAAAGVTLARLGDPRLRPDAWYLPAEPLLGFVEVPEGEFLMGSDPDRDTGAHADERPQHPVKVRRYFIGCYPVTVAQFAAFVESSGYPPSDRNCLRRGLANHPVALMTFDDALGYCDWLGKTLRDWDETPEPLAGLLRGGDYRLTLPSEAEWERAARGPNGHLYPWGDDPPEPRHANYRDTGIGGTSPVGSFPDGASACGCLDMAGNVWEWTRSLWGRCREKPDFGYPYASGDGREDLAAGRDTLRVLRGGAFGNGVSSLRCAYRDWYYHPDAQACRVSCGRVPIDLWTLILCAPRTLRCNPR